MERRRLLRLSGGIGSALLAGCTGTSDDDGSSIQDSDGDGVIDSEDYAPDDPDVQEKSDLQSKTTATKKASTERTTTATTTTTTTTTTATPTTTTTSKPDPNELRADSDFFETDSHVASYTSEEVTVVINPDDPTLDGVDLSNYDVATATMEFPRVADVSLNESRSALSPNSKSEVSVSIDLTDAPTETPLHHLLFLVPEGETLTSADLSQVIHVNESDPFVLESDGVTLSRTTIPELEPITDDSGDHHERSVAEGVIGLEVTGRSLGKDWSSTFYVFKSYYVETVRRDHGRSREQFVTYEMQDGFAREVATLLQENAKANGFEGKREQAEMVIDFVQHLPYVPDDVSTGYDDYTKFVAETLVEAGGDCEDSAILMASVLQAEPFGYDTVLIQPPEHMAVGIKGSDDLSGAYWEYDGNKYFYIETTGIGWGVGDIPEEYEDEKAYVYQV